MHFPSCPRRGSAAACLSSLRPTGNFSLFLSWHLRLPFSTGTSVHYFHTAAGQYWLLDCLSGCRCSRSSRDDSYCVCLTGTTYGFLVSLCCVPWGQQSYIDNTLHSTAVKAHWAWALSRCQSFVQMQEIHSVFNTRDHMCQFIVLSFSLNWCFKCHLLCRSSQNEDI